MIDAKELGIPEHLLNDGKPYASASIAITELVNMRRSFSMDIPLGFAVDKKGRKIKRPINRPKDKLPRGMVRCFTRLGHLILPSRS